MTTVVSVYAPNDRINVRLKINTMTAGAPNVAQPWVPYLDSKGAAAPTSPPSVSATKQ